MATATELFRVAQHMADVGSPRDVIVHLVLEAKRLQAIEAERSEVVHVAASDATGAACTRSLMPGHVVTTDEALVTCDVCRCIMVGGVSHLIDPCSRAPRCAGYMYRGDSVAIDCEPTCPGCLNWRAQFGDDDDEGDVVEVRTKRSWPEGWPPFAVLRRAHMRIGVPARPSTKRLEMLRGCKSEPMRRWWRESLEAVLEDAR